MAFNRFYRVLPVIILLLFAQSAHAQSSIYDPHMAWRKKVTRDIEIRVSKAPTQPASTAGDSSLAEMMVNDILKGKIVAKSNTANDFTNTLTTDDVSRAMGINPDATTNIYGKEKKTTDAHKNGAIYDSIYKYRIFEQWQFNPSTGATDISIRGIAPVRNGYVNGVLQSAEAIFWVSYPDAREILARYRAKHPNNSFYTYAWSDYFSKSNKVATQGVMLKNTVVRLIDFAEKEDIPHHSTDIGDEPTFLNLIDDQIAKGAIIVYDTAGNTVKRRGGITGQDSISTIEVTTRQQPQNISRHESPIAYPRYIRVVEFWTFNTTGGDIHIHNIHVQMTNTVGDEQKADGEPSTTSPPWFGAWIRYGDVKDILVAYEQTHPANNFATKIWNNYFYSGVKPVVVK